ncbi:nicotinamide-nucleotide amidase [Bacillus mesophilus]|uniref:Putative competence-damage inducible protein n=1 Tax=Bacillus mesophilus TaxID=1808955 RepID=A0A6M0Q1X0_9BACI|nr:competence/damage-inducible protein A [Bacillus mesophilus]MBM7659288.1 nicotinamide-nucleotide amidase [Bacillus mesophilus]NEY70162.1 competence/damage-inducible protein A [Bacillus mesophilus]
MNAEIIAVGSELLLGQIANTNAQFLSKQLAEVGVNVYYHTVVGDNPERLKQSIKLAEARADLLIFTGGLGPTKDDLTKETIASVLGRKLVMDEEALHSIEEYFHKVNRIMTENNKKQALVLEGCDVLPNRFGMAPGMFLTSKEHHYMLLPGPPKEMQPMFIHFGRPAIMKELKIQEIIESRVLRFFGIGESQLETEITDLIDAQTNPTIAPLAADYEVTLRLTAKHQTLGEATLLLDEVEQQIMGRVGEYFYGYGETSLAREVMSLLQEKGLTLAAAESLTGGMFSQSLTKISGASKVVKGGIVCYTNDVKEHVLKVAPSTLEKEGAVSKQCSKELAENSKQLLNADIGISFTGVAGPDSLEGKPVGTVYIGISLPTNETKTFVVKLAGSREAIRERSVRYGLYYLIRELL